MYLIFFFTNQSEQKKLQYRTSYIIKIENINQSVHIDNKEYSIIKTV